MIILDLINKYKRNKIVERENRIENNKLFTKDKKKYKKYDIGEGTYGEPNIFDWGDDIKLKIGKYCSIATNVTILLGGEHIKTSVSTYPFYSIAALKENRRTDTAMPDRKHKGDITIGSDVWIGHGVTILSGVTIGHGAIIGASTTVAKSVPDYAIVIGNPAKVVGYRFSEVQIEKLLKIKWWNWSSDKIEKEKFNLVSCDIQTFIDKYDGQLI